MEWDDWIVAKEVSKPDTVPVAVVMPYAAVEEAADAVVRVAEIAEAAKAVVTDSTFADADAAGLEFAAVIMVGSSLAVNVTDVDSLMFR